MLLLTLLIAPLIFGAASTQADVIEVPGDFPTIQQAVNSSSPGDEIVISSGLYPERVAILGHSILLIRSQSDAASTIVDGGLIGPVFNIENGAAITIRALTIRNGNSGIKVRDCDHVTIQDNIISGNIGSGDGGGISVIFSYDTRIENNKILSNRANVGAGLDGGGIFFHGYTGVVNGNRIEGNVAHEGGGIIINQPTVSLTVMGNVFLGNQASYYGGGIYINVGTHPLIRSNTVTGNSAGVSGGGIWYTDQSGPTIERNIVVRNSAPVGGGVHAALPPAMTTFACNDTWDNPGGNYTGYQTDPTGANGNISIDPRFCNVAIGDFRLDESSPCAPANSPTGCGLIGALDVGCGVTAADVSTWGRIKSRFSIKR